MGNYLETLKNITKSKDRKVENLIFLVIALAVILIVLGYIFQTPKSNNNTGALVNNSTKNSNSTSNNSNINNNEDIKDQMESKLGNILSQVLGISDVSVMLTYSQDSKQTPIYNTKESEKTGEKTVEKSVAYNEQNNSKTAIIESVEMPKVEGAIVVAKGASTVEIRSKIASAISSVTNVPVYKIQVFEKK